MEEMDSGYDDMALIIYLIILFNRTEFPDEYKELLIKSEYWDVYLENLIQILDPTWQISTDNLADKYGRTVLPKIHQCGISIRGGGAVKRKQGGSRPTVKEVS